MTRLTAALLRWRDPIAAVVLAAGLALAALGWRP
jgi:hypothetical protein